jgi:hypothetical protein
MHLSYRTLCALPFLVFLAAAGSPPPVPTTSVPAKSVPASPVPPDVQKRVIDSFSNAFVYPDTAIWKFDGYPPFAAGGNVACGRVNYQDSTRAYIGYRGFYVVLRGPNIDASSVLPRFPWQDPTGARTNSYHELCDAVTPKTD